jgi:signal transduction histidine kinase/CheY-like chemotaxis protein/HPt (histidine-containing phosphotransfer) domain-containing protein/HAMP domain-containing protein
LMAEVIPFSRTISVRLLRLLLPMVSLALLVLFGALEVRYYVAQRAALVGEIKDQLSVQEAAFSRAIWEYNDEQISALVNDISDLPFVTSIAVYDVDGEVMASKGDYEAEPESVDMRQRGIVNRTVGGKPEKVGELVLTGYSGHIWTEIGDRILLDFLILLVMSAALTGVTFFATRNVIGRPLDRLRDAIDRVDAEKVYTQVEWTSTDELGSLVQNFNRMQRRREDAEGELQKYQDELEHLVEARSQEALAAWTQLQFALDNMQEAIFALDADFRFIMFNRRYIEMYKLPDGMPEVGMPVQQVMHYLADDGRYGEGDIDELVADRMAILMDRNGRIFDIETADGRWLEGRQSGVEGGGVVIVISDVTARKQNDAELVLAKEAAESATRAKSSFLAAMSHEIRTPMNGVIGMIDLLWQGHLEAEQRKMLGTIRSSAFSLLQIINDILDFSKIEAGKLDLELLPISIRDVVEGVAETLLPEVQKKRLRLRIFIDPDIPARVTADQVRLRQILFNLMGNAVKFTDNREGRSGEVYIGAYATPPTGDEKARVTFAIRDSGIGMTEESRKGLFQPFTQAEESTTRRFGGTGLGLSICKNLTDIMGGSITVESGVGKGSTFSVSIPFHEVTDPGAEADEEDVRNLKVLVVTDDALSAKNIPHYLSTRGAIPEMIEDVDMVATQIQHAQADGSGHDVVVFSLNNKLPSIWQAIEECRKVAQGDVPRYVILDDTRTEKRGQRPPDMVIIEAAPMMRSSFIRGVAMAAGRASPDINDQVVDEIKGTRKAPSIEVAEANNELILIAEDNLTNQDVIRRQLNLLGYTAEIVDDGELGLEAWRSGRYGLILTDCHMPNMDGYEMTEAIRGAESSTGERIPIVAITANALQGEADRCLASGMDDYLSKPLEMLKLRRTLTKWLPQAGQYDAQVEIETSTPASLELVEDEENAKTSNNLKDNIDSPVDPQALKGVFGDDEETFREILADFVDPATSNVKEITDAAAAGDVAGVGSAAHKLKSSSRSVGATYLGELCEQLEKAGKSGDADLVAELAPTVPAVLADVIGYIKAL